MRQTGGIKPQDIVVLLKLAANKGRNWRIIDLAQELGISLSETSAALERGRRAGLLDDSKKKIVPRALLEFIIYGLKYVYPAQPGQLCRGVPTAHSAKPLSDGIISDEREQYVWPCGEGRARGQAVEPLYPSVPQAALKDIRLHELLALVDALRVGRARERQLAAEKLRNRLFHAA